MSTAPVSAVPAGAADLGRRERRKLELRGRILEAASELFRTQGFHETRVAEICERADIAHKTFFNHFKSKQHLLRALADFGVDRLVVRTEEARRAAPSTRERLLRFFRAIAEHTAGGGAMSRELVTELVHALNDAREERSLSAQRLHDAFGAIVQEGLAAGEVTRRHDAETLTEMVLGAYYVLIFNYANLDDFPIERQAEAAARFLADALAPHPEETDGPS